MSEARINGDPFAPELLAPNYGDTGVAYTGAQERELYTVEVRPPTNMREALLQAEAQFRAAGEAREDIDSLLQAMVAAGVTPEMLEQAANNEPLPIEILPLGGDGAFVNRCREMIEQVQNQMMQNMGVPREVLAGAPEAMSMAAMRLADMRLADQQFQRMLDAGLVSRRSAEIRMGFDPAQEANTIFVNRATASDIQRAWGYDLAENELRDRMWEAMVNARAAYAQELGRPVSLEQLETYMRIGEELSVYTRAEEGRDAYSHEVVAYIRAVEACDRSPLTYEQTPRPLVTANERERLVMVSIENRDTVPADLLEILERRIADYPAITELRIAEDSAFLDNLMALLRADFDEYMRGRNRNYLSYHFAVRRDMNELSMEEVREWTGSGPSEHETGLSFANTAGTPPPPLYAGFGTKAAWSSDEIETRQRDPRLRSDQVESLVLRMRDICRTRNFVLDGCKYTLNAAAPVVNNCRTFVFKVMVPTDSGLRFRLLVRILQKIDDRGLSQWGYQVTEENSDVVIRAPRTYNNPEAVRDQQARQHREDQRAAEQARVRALRSAFNARNGLPEEPLPPPPPPPPARLSRKPDDEPLPEGRPLDL